MIWNIYFGVLALITGFFLANAVAMGKASNNRIARKASEWFIFIFRGSPLFIQFFFAYFLFLSLKSQFAFFTPFTAAWLGALIVLFLNTAAYSGEIFYGAYQSIPKGDVEAADAYGMSGWSRFRRIMWPTMMRLAWPAYTNEAIFLFHATTLVYFSGFPGMATEGGRALLRELFRGQDVQPLRALPDPGLLFHPDDAGDRRDLRTGEQAPQPAPATGSPAQDQASTEPAALKLFRGWPVCPPSPEHPAPRPSLLPLLPLFRVSCLDRW